MAEESNPKRLCSEIQLFDLCSKDICAQKDGRYCVNTEILAKFEAISEEDVSLQDQYIDEETDELDDSDDAEYDDGCFDDFDREYEDEDEEE